jgi:hypothetical protein
MDWVIGVAGLALVLAPFVLGIHGFAAWFIAIGGVIIAFLGGYRAIARDTDIWEEAYVVPTAVIATVAAAFGAAPWYARVPVAAIAAGIAILAFVQLRRGRELPPLDDGGPLPPPPLP